MNDLTNEDIRALLFYSAAKSNSPTTVTLLSKKIFEARQKKLPTGTIPLRRVPNGYYSAYIAQSAGLLVAGGLAKRKSPLVITEKGLNRLSESVSEIMKTNEREAKAWLDFLGVH